ncbi:MAG TPA: MoaD/ThiS family protein [Candidatus Anoxymicrobiaceae bacterium]
MRVATLFAGIVRMQVGERHKVLEVEEGSTAADLLDRLGEECGPRLPRSLWDPEAGRFHKSIRLARRGGPVLDPADTLSDGDEILFIFPMAGG